MLTIGGIGAADAQIKIAHKPFYEQHLNNYQARPALFEFSRYAVGAPLNNYGYWGAIAYSFSNGTDGSAWDYSTEREAANNALRSCARSDCRVLVTFESECGAIAFGGGNGWGGGYGYNHDEARGAALNTCRKYGNKDCRVAASVCTSMDE